MAFNPFFYHDSPLPMELIYKAIGDLCYLMPTVEQLKKTVDDLLKDMDEAIQEEVGKVIDEMYQSGELEDLLGEYFIKYIDGKPLNSNLEFGRIYRHVWSIGDNFAYYQNEDLSLRPCKCEGGTFIEYGGLTYYAFGLIKQGVHSTNDSEQGAIILIEGKDYAEGNPNNWSIAGQVSVTMNHMNSMDYNPKDNYLYVAGGQNADGTKNSNLYRIHITEILGKNKPSDNSSYNNLNNLVNGYQPVYSNIDLENIITDVPTPEDIASNNVSYSNDLPANHIYVGTGRVRVYEIDFEAQTVIKKMYTNALVEAVDSLKAEFNDDVTGYQASVISGDYIYCLWFRPSIILRANLITQEVEYIYNLPQILDNGYFVMGEPTDIKICDNGDILLFTELPIFQGYAKQYRMTQIFKSNLFNNFMQSPQKIELIKREPLVVYVDRTAGTTNPRGQTTGDAFTSIAEAVLFANNNEIADSITIRLRTTSNAYIQVSANKKIRIVTDSNPISGEINSTHNKAIIGGVSVSGGNLILEDVMVDMTLPDSSVPNNPNGAYIYVYDGKLNAHNVFINQNHDTVPNAYRIVYSTAVISGTDDYTVESNSVSATGGTAWAGGASNFIKDKAASINAHGTATVSGGVFA